MYSIIVLNLDSQVLIKALQTKNTCRQTTIFFNEKNNNLKVFRTKYEVRELEATSKKYIYS